MISALWLIPVAIVAFLFGATVVTAAGMKTEPPPDDPRRALIATDPDFEDGAP